MNDGTGPADRMAGELQKSPHLYKKIAAELIIKIRSGELPPCFRLPSGRELAREFGASGATGNKAQALVAESGLGLAEREHGRYISVAHVNDSGQPAPRQVTAWSSSTSRAENIMGDAADAILTGRTAPGSPLDPATFAAQWNCDEHTAWQALRRLCQWPGLVIMTGGRLYAAGKPAASAPLRQGTSR